MDDDTLEVLHNNRPERIRLSGIDCPEKGQAYGKRAKQAASELVYGKEVTVQTHGQDKYGRTITDVLLPDGTNVNQELVKDGWCWWYRKYAPADTVLEGLEKAPERLRAVSGSAPVPPWEWRICTSVLHPIHGRLSWNKFFTNSHRIWRWRRTSYSRGSGSRDYRAGSCSGTPNWNTKKLKL